MQHSLLNKCWRKGKAVNGEQKQNIGGVVLSVLFKHGVWQVILAVTQPMCLLPMC